MREAQEKAVSGIYKKVQGNAGIMQNIRDDENQTVTKGSKKYIREIEEQQYSSSKRNNSVGAWH